MSDDVEKEENLHKKLKSLRDEFDKRKKIKSAYSGKREKVNRPMGYCSMVFHVWQEDGEVGYEVLEDGAGSNDFMFMSRDAYEVMKKDRGWGTTRPASDWLCEFWHESDMKQIVMEEIVGEIDLEDGEDRYFEFNADYKVTSSVDYWGEYDCEDEVFNENWHEIAKEEYDEFNRDTMYRLEELLGTDKNTGEEL